MSSDAYAGLRRRKQTPWRVKFGDALVSRLITIGGMGTIAAVLLVVLVLLATAWPLHRSPQLSAWRVVPADIAGVRHAGCDEFGLIVWAVGDAGRLSVLSAATGQTIQVYDPPGTLDRQVTSSAVSIDRQQLVLGFSDGTFQRATFVFQTSLLTENQLPADLGLSADEPVIVHEGAIYQRFDESAVRRLQLAPPVWSAPEKIADRSLVSLDFIPPDTSNQFSQQASAKMLAATDSELIVVDIEARENLLTGELTQEVVIARGALESRSKRPPMAIMLANMGTQAIVAWDNGTLDRFALTSTGPQIVESVSGLLKGGRITAATPMLARQTLLLGDDTGRLHGWNIVQTDDAGAAQDGYRLTATHEIAIAETAITSLSSSSASHLAVVGCADSQLALVLTTTDSLLRRSPLPESLEIADAFLQPKNDGIFAISSKQLVGAALDVAYPEASWRGLFGRVWYEGHAEPKYIWQSSAGTEQSEPKFSLIPLVFGTLKATVYAMAVSVPLALLAAIYTSEFLTPRMRGRVKPIIELMASLPSVILGFIAALVLAPILQDYLCAVLLSLFLIPATFLFVAHAWNLLPLELIVRWQGWRLWFLVACLPLAIGIAVNIAPAVERWLFASDIVQWMSGSIGNGIGGWMLLLIPVVAALATFLMLGPLAEWNRHRAVKMTPRQFALRGLGQLIVMMLAVVSLAWLVSALLNAAGLDLRQSVFAGYQERNAMLVGAVLGFCVIPLIYTLADDALQSVPQQLRSASLGCGATPWQTTIRVVVPSAMSGMFSAIMIGLGRAVGETMVVLMAAGNTPVMEWNPFNGFRTLSATLATELPEAAKGSTHFRTLFLAALLLFTLTLLANTLAEFVRMRFRRRGSQL